ncbi:hypothetical protein BH10BAC2_BH10BAC2_02120 [soil metagenome]
MNSNSSFDRLDKRLHRLVNDTENEVEIEYVAKHSIDDVLNGGILTNDFENSQDLLNYYISKVEEIKKSVPSLIENHNFKGLKSIFDSEYISQEEMRTKIITNLIQELDFYIEQLTKIDESLMDKMSEMGNDKFANAGFRVRLELTVPEIGSLFNAFLTERILKKIDGTALTKTELGMFLFKNFGSKDIQQFSYKNIVNHLSIKEIKAAGHIEEILERILEKFKTGT